MNTQSCLAFVLNFGSSSWLFEGTDPILLNCKRRVVFISIGYLIATSFLISYADESAVPLASSRQTPRESKVRELESELIIEEMGEFHSRYTAFFDLGPVKAGSDTPLVLKITNTAKYAFDIDTIRTSCSCLAVNAEKGIYEPGDEIVIDTVIQIPTKSAMARGFQSMTLVDRLIAGKEIEVKIAFEAEGLLGFSGSPYFFEIPDDKPQATISVPMTISNPIRPELLDVDFDPPGIVDKHDFVSTGDGKTLLKIRLNTEKIPVAGVALAVQVNDEPSSRSETSTIRISKQERIAVRPRRIHFQSRGDLLIATGILKIQPSGDAADRDGEPPPQPIVTASIGNRNLQCSVQYIDNHVWRLTLEDRIDRWQNEKLSNESIIKWSISSSQGSSVQNTALFVSPRIFEHSNE